MALEHTDLISLVAEVAATFIGFSLVIGLLQPEDPSAARRLQSMRAVAELALIAAGGALLALALDAFHLIPAHVWRFASAVLLVFWFTLHLLAIRRFKSAGTLLRESGFLQFAGFIALIGVALLLWNLIAPGAQSGGRYTAALICALADSAFMFILATFSDGHEGPAT